MHPKILVINPGSSSSKVAIFLGEKLVLEKVAKHDSHVTEKFASVIDQLAFRKKIVTDFLEEEKISLEEIDIFVGRGGLVHPLESGTYLVNEKMLLDLHEAKFGSHTCNLGAIIASQLASVVGKDAYIVDPVIVDELDEVARVSGLKGLKRKSIFHALNQKAVAKRYALENNKEYRDLTLVVAHLGSGISVGLHQFGKVIDVNNAFGGDGPFSPERTGDLPIYDLVDLCYSKKYTISEMKKMLVSQGGLVSYLNTNNGVEISKKIKEDDKEARLYFKAMAYQIVKEIGSLYFVAGGKVDAVILTGGLSYNSDLIAYIKNYLPKFVNLQIYVGEDEMSALALGALRVYEGKEKVKTY